MTRRTATSQYTVKQIIHNNLCVYCGLCAAVCPESAVEMFWHGNGSWIPVIDVDNCVDCGLCYAVCPQSPECIAEYTSVALKTGERFGLSADYHYFISYDKNVSMRIKSASGGTISAILKHLLGSNDVSGVIASQPLLATIGNPHYQLCISRTPEDLDKGRSSHYSTLSYHKVLTEMSGGPEKLILIGVPCVMRGIAKLPDNLQRKIKYKICLSCGRNATAAIIDYLAQAEGVKENESFYVNLRDKVGIPNANNYNIHYRLADREIRKNRYETAWTVLWRNYYFAPECCLYCPDFYGADADMTVKDAWGRLSGDPLGTSLLIVRNPELLEPLNELNEMGGLYLESCDEDEIYNSQTVTPIFKHVQIRDRLVWKKIIRDELKKDKYSIDTTRRWWRRHSYEYFRLKSTLYLSTVLYSRFGHSTISIMLCSANSLKMISRLINKTASFTLKAGKLAARIIQLMCFRQKKHANGLNGLKVLISGGYGYGNIGDEVQLAANLQRWKKESPSSQVTVLTPDPEYTKTVHPDILVELAPRISLFGIKGKAYFGSERLFKILFFILAPLYLFNARLMRADLPVFGLTSKQARMLDIIKNSDVLFLSGGGYLTGMTLTRLWDNMLLMGLAHSFGLSVLLSGQTIGLFNDGVSRWLARWGLKKADLIYLRDADSSPGALCSIGIEKNNIACTFDDALFYSAMPQAKVMDHLKQYGIKPDAPYLAVNVHYWGQTGSMIDIITKQIASALDRIQAELNFHIVFVPMVKSDEEATHKVIELMESPGIFPEHHYNLELAVGLIKSANLCLTMKHHPIIFAIAESIPVISMAFDAYYLHKNRGALKLFGLEEFCVSCNPEVLGETIFDKIIQAHQQRKKIADKISPKIESMRTRSAELITLWLKSNKI